MPDYIKQNNNTYKYISLYTYAHNIGLYYPILEHT